MEIKELTSPNCDTRPEGQTVDMLVLHYTGMQSAAAALERLCDSSARVSAHYLIDENGGVYRLVGEHLRAWHAGVASWAGTTDVNARSIGIELVNPGHEWGYRSFPDAQMTALIDLARTAVEQHRIPAHRVLAHSDVAPQRRQDPGELFDWGRLAEKGIGMVADASAFQGTAMSLQRGDEGAAVKVLQRKLAAFGYGVCAEAVYDQLTEGVVRAFQRHHRQAAVTGIADRETVLALDNLLDQIERLA